MRVFLFLAFLAVANAAVTTLQTDSRTVAFGATATFDFVKFDPTLGTLTDAIGHLSVTASSLILFVNNADTVSYTLTHLAGTGTAVVQYGSDVDDPITVVVSTTDPTLSVNLPASTSPAYTRTVSTLTNVGGASSDVTDSTVLAADYIGSGPTDSLVITVSPYVSISHGLANPNTTPNDVSKISYGGSGTVTVTTTLQYTYTASTSGDPQIVGFQGQRFQVHGTPDEHYSLISTANYYINSQFVYMANGLCNYNETECFSHPGTYIGVISFVTSDNRVKIAAGPHATGLSVYINDRLAPVGTRVKFSNDSHIHVLSRSRVSLSTEDFTLSCVNSDLFLNLGIDFTNAPVLHAGHIKVVVPGSATAAEADTLISRAYPEFPMHGLLGQTWRNVEWPHRRLYQGEPSDYVVGSLFGPEFLYNQYL